MQKTYPPSEGLDRSDWLHLLLCLLGGCGISFALLLGALHTVLEPKLLAETAVRTSRSVRLVELALKVVPPDQLPPGVIVRSSVGSPEGDLRPLGVFDRKVARLMATRYGLARPMQRDRPPFVESWGGMWVRLDTSLPPPLWLYQPERLSSSSVWFLPLLRSAALLLGLSIGTVVFLRTRVEAPFKRALAGLPHDLPAPLPLLPELGIAPLRLLTLRINRLLERLNGAATERRQLLRGIVHDLAGPQTRIGLQLEVLEDLLEPAHRQRLPAIRSDMQQLAGITEQLGLLAERDQPAMAVHQLALDDLCVRVASSYGRQTIRLAVPRLLVQLDGAGLERALRNLIDNACDHGQPPVEISAWRRGPTLVVQVRDQGATVASPTLLTTAPASPAHDRQRGRHRGLGLAIVERFCRDHRGTLRLDPTVGGFTVRMELLASPAGPVLLQQSSLRELVQPSR